MSKIKKLACDVIVVGSGGSGSSAAQAVAEQGLEVISNFKRSHGFFRYENMRRSDDS